MASNLNPLGNDAEIAPILDSNEAGNVEASNEPLLDVGTEATPIIDVPEANSSEVFADFDQSLSGAGAQLTSSDVQTTTILDSNESDLNTGSNTSAFEMENEGIIHPTTSLENQPELLAELRR